MLGKGNDLDDSLGGRLRRAREQRGWAMRDLARHSGVDPSSVSEIERGIIKSPRAVTIAKLADALGIDAAQIYGTAPQVPRARVQMGVAYVPIVERMIHAGSGGSGDSWRDTGETIPIGGDFAKPNHRLLAGRVTGSCMLPHVEPGDIVIWDQSADYWTDRQMVAVTVGTDLLVKWAYRELDGSVVLVANDGTEIRPNGVILEGPIVHIQRQPVRGPHRG